MENTLVMSFKDESGRKSSIKVDKVKDDLTREKVEAIMDFIIASSIFTTKTGELKNKVSAEVVGKTVNSLL